MINKRTLEGQTFGRLEVLNLGHPDPKTCNRRWSCRCVCGTVQLVWESALVRGHKKSCGCLHKFSESVAAKNQVRDSYRRGAKKRGLSWELPDVEFDRLAGRRCFYCGEEPANLSKSKNGNFAYNGIDRLKNSEGYTILNCVTCCKTCNFMKRTLGAKEFLRHVKRIVLNTFQLWELSAEHPDQEETCEKNRLILVHGNPRISVG